MDAESKIGYVQECFRLSEQLPQECNVPCLLNTQGSPRVIYTSTYYNTRPNFLRIFFGGEPFDGTPRQLAADLNVFLSGYLFKQGRHYGWIMMNFPQDAVIAAIVQSNLFS